MPFANIDSTNMFPQAKKVEFLTLKPGQTVIRILDANAVLYLTHYLEGATVMCTGDGCPICQSNERLIVDNPETYKNIKAYSPRIRRYHVNVLDRTLMKVCPSCNTEMKKIGNSFPAACTNCNTMLLEVKEAQSNKVKVLSRGVQLFEQFNALEESVLDDKGNPMPITSYDIVLSVSGTGRQTKITAIPLANKNEPVNVDEKSLFDLTKTIIKLNNEEMIDLQKGISLRDIFAARGTGEKEDNTEDKTLSLNVEETVQELFGGG